jgi:sugar phosphate permease
VGVDTPFRRGLFMFSLVVAGEAVFALPFHVTRYFRPTVLSVFGFSNTELGQAMAAYGVVAMLAYFPGGLLADRFTARSLITSSLLLTAIGGMYMATIPDVTGMAMLWAFWGLTSILMLWAALIRSTRDWGGRERQGTAYGILDAGRGLFGALLAVATAQAFAWFMPDDVEGATAAMRATAMRNIIWMYVAATLAAAGLAWFGIPAIQPQVFSTPVETARTRPSASVRARFAFHGLIVSTSETRLWQHLGPVLRMPAIWLQSLIVVAAYVAYKATDDFGLFAKEAYAMDEVESAWISGVSAWIRPFAALLAGFLADRSSASRVAMACFVTLMVGFGAMASTTAVAGLVWMLVTQIAIVCVAVYGLRGVYFALFEQASVPLAATGTAVGIVSVVGYTPDIFSGLVLGLILDAYPGAHGHRLYFAVVAAVSGVGLLATLAFARTVRKPS